VPEEPALPARIRAYYSNLGVAPTAITAAFGRVCNISYHTAASIMAGQAVSLPVANRVVELSPIATTVTELVEGTHEQDAQKQSTPAPSRAKG